MVQKEKFNQFLDEQFMNASDEDKQWMLNEVMEKCRKNMSKENYETFKSNYMENKENYSKTNPMMGMMSTMMKGMMKSRMGEKHSMMSMCREMMKEKTNQSHDESYTTDELMDLFKDWCSHVEDEILSFVNETGEVNEEKIAEKFNLSKESVNHLIKNLQKSGKIN